MYESQSALRSRALVYLDSTVKPELKPLTRYVEDRALLSCVAGSHFMLYHTEVPLAVAEITSNSCTQAQSGARSPDS